jgi:hypothetical protein
LFNKYPINSVRQQLDTHPLSVGYQPIIDHILSHITNPQKDCFIVAIDGTNGVDYQAFLQPLSNTSRSESLWAGKSLKALAYSKAA